MNGPMSLRRNLIAFAIALIVGASCARGQEGLASGPVVTAVARDALARTLLGDVRPEASWPVFTEPVVSQRYVDASGAFIGTLDVAIYADSAAAERAFDSMLPQMIRGTIEGPDREGWTTATGAMIRHRNVILGVNEPGESGTGVEVARQRSMLDKLAELADDPRHVRFGDRVDVPAAEVISMTRMVSVRPEPSIKVVVRQPPADTRRTLVSPQAEAMTDELRELPVRRRLLEGETILRIARPTGEVAEIRIDDLIARGMAIADPPAPVRPTLGPARKRNLIAALDRNDSYAAAKRFAELASHADESLLPVFRQALTADWPGSVKQHALRGLGSVLGTGGLEEYRVLAADTAQPEILRIDAARLLARHGGDRAPFLLRALDTENAPELERIIERLLARTSGSGS